MKGVLLRVSQLVKKGKDMVVWVDERNAYTAINTIKDMPASVVAPSIVLMMKKKCAT